MDSIEVERRLALEKSIESMSEEENSFKYLPQPQRHEDNRLDRLILLKAFKQVIDPIINHHIHPKDKSPVLEVGCATGFFSRHLAPNWLQKRLISFDINTPALQRMKYDGCTGSIVQGSVYNLPFADNSLGTVVGYSSFDSFLFLDQAISETFRVLKAGGKVIWFQDLVTELYQFEKNPTHEEKLDTVERYHQILVNTVRKSNFNILEGEDVYLETHALEPLETVQRRVPGLETNPRIFPIPVIWDCGSLRPVLRRNLLTSIDKANKTATEKAIDDHGEELVTKYFPQYQKYGGHLLEILNMRYLTAEKPKADSTSVKLGFLSNLRKYFFPKAI